VRRSAALVALVASLAACSQGVAGLGTATRPGARSFPTDAGGLGRLLAGNRDATTGHLTLIETGAALQIRTSGDVRIDGGTVEALDATESINRSSFHYILIHKQVYADLPPGFPSPSVKPWTEITRATPTRALGLVFRFAQTPRVLSRLLATKLLQRDARSARLRRTTHLRGETVGDFAVELDPWLLPAGYPERSAIRNSGASVLPVELWVDGRGRLLRAEEPTMLHGHPTRIRYDLTDVGRAVYIQPPPRDQVSKS
jgi:hypothetical protein